MILFLISLIPFIIYVFYKSLKSYQMLQQNYYDNKMRYLKWIKNNLNKVFLNIDIIFIFLLLFCLVKINNVLLNVIFAILYLVLFIIYKLNISKEQVKKPLVITKRVQRMIGTEVILYLVFIVIMGIFFNKDYILYYYLFLGLSAYLNYLVIWLINIINVPVEKLVYLSFKNKAMNKLKNLNIPVIGITGSYGKTSCKNIVSDILNVKMNAIPTPKSFNTNYGLIRTINENLDKFSDLFIAEMGACRLGEIKSACEIVSPKYGIITRIGDAHLETFKSRENILKCKFELAESIPEDGIIVLNKDDSRQVQYVKENSGKIKGKIIWISIENESDFQAKDINITKDGSSFKININNNTYEFKTRLLGKHNIYNILGAVALGYNLGLSMDELIRGVLRVKQIPHRLELKNMGDLIIIDDAFNSNPVGSKSALDVLNMMEGIKIIATPGMVELGEEEYKLNYEFGTFISKVCDYVILVGKMQTKPIQDALDKCNFDKNKIFIINDVKEAFTISRNIEGKNKYLLLENDLPDLYNERKINNEN